MEYTFTITYDGTPRHLYKFWAMPRDGAIEERHLRDLIVDHKLYFQSADRLNDPYDCLPAIYADFTPERARRLFERHVRRENPNLDNEECKAQIEQMVAKFDFDVIGTPEFQLGAADIFKEHRKKFAVYCLSERIDSVLMWSHYAQNHTGFAVRFDGSDPFIREAQRVRYLRDRPLFDPGAREPERMGEALLVKARDWKYEEEWRITRIGQPGLHEFAPAAITGIIFGMAMPDAKRAVIKSICGEGGLDPTYYEAIDDARSFSTQIVELR